MTTGQLLEIACDESGSEGEKLIGGNTAVFAHASVRLDAASAASCIDEVRKRAPSPTIEYKSDVIRRKKHREALKWMLGSSALRGNARVYLIDKTYFVIHRITGLLLPRDQQTTALELYREGERTFGPAQWHALLTSFNDLMRTRNGRSPGPSVDSVFTQLDLLSRVENPLAKTLSLLWQSRPILDAFRAQLPTTMPVLDPLIPAIIQAAAYWSQGLAPISIVHDRQTLLTDGRIAQLKQSINGRLAGLRLVDSRTDPRVQAADLLVGAARQIAEDELTGNGDADLTALLSPYVDASSIWGDTRSWSLLNPAP